MPKTANISDSFIKRFQMIEMLQVNAHYLVGRLIVTQNVPRKISINSCKNLANTHRHAKTYIGQESVVHEILAASKHLQLLIYFITIQQVTIYTIIK